MGPRGENWLILAAWPPQLILATWPPQLILATWPPQLILATWPPQLILAKWWPTPADYRHEASLDDMIVTILVKWYNFLLLFFIPALC